MSGKYEQYKNRISKMGAGDDPLSPEQRIEILNQIYDGALFWLAECVITKSAKGTGAVTSILERARLEMNDLSRSGDLDESRYNNIIRYNLVTGKYDADSGDIPENSA